MENDFVLQGDVVRKLIEENLPKMIGETLASSYGSPLKKAIEAELTAQDGAIKVLIREIFGQVLTDPKLREKLAQEVIATVVQKGLQR